MSPEAITGGRDGVKVGRPSDIWSLGCILYQMVYGRTPFAHLPFIQKMHTITDEAHVIDFPECGNHDCLEVMHACLDFHPRRRLSIPQLLEHPFLHPGGCGRGRGGPLSDTRKAVTGPRAEAVEAHHLHPNPNPNPNHPVPGHPTLTTAQLVTLLEQMCQAQGRPDLDPRTMAAAVMRQLAQGQPLDLMQFFASQPPREIPAPQAHAHHTPNAIPTPTPTPTSTPAPTPTL
jgi:serine/threonine-protein kinase TTK/MPS1